MNISNHALGGVFFDTHAAIKQLQKAGASEKLAEAQVELLSRFAEKELVTKGHFDLTIADIKVEMQKIKGEILKWVLGFLAIQTSALIALLIKLL